MGNYILCQQHGQTVVLSASETKKNKGTPAHRAVRQRFGEAQTYAADVLADPLKREGYRDLAAAWKKPINPKLVSSFLTPPAVSPRGLAEFRGQAKDVIRALATDAIEVVGVAVTALAAGAALKNHGVWSYRCTTALGGKAKQLEVTATNRARRTGRGAIRREPGPLPLNHRFT